MKQQFPPHHDRDDRNDRADHAAPTARDGHERHDAMLIARLYGDDVSDREREVALDRIAGCGECAQLYADLAAIADATVHLPTPARQRDFTLTEADADRLGRPIAAGSKAGLRWLGLRRSFGGALAALGLVGVVLAGAGSFLNPATHNSSLVSGYAAAPQDAAAPEANASGGNLVVSGGDTGPTPGSQPLPAMTPGPALETPRGAMTSPALTAVTPAVATPPPPPPTAIATPGNKSVGDGTASGTPAPQQVGPLAVGTSGTGSSGGSSGATSGGGDQRGPSAVSTNSGPTFDPAGIVFPAALLALVLGVALLAGPRLLRLASAASHRRR